MMPLKAYSCIRSATGSNMVPSAPAGHLLEVSNIQMTLRGTGSYVPRGVGDYIHLLVREETDVMPIILTLRGHMLNDIYARVQTWTYAAGPPETWTATGTTVVQSMMPNFVSIQAAGPFTFGRGVELWFSAVLTTAGVSATGSLLYRFLPVDEEEFAEAQPAPVSASKPFPFAWQRIIPGAYV